MQTSCELSLLIVFAIGLAVAPKARSEIIFDQDFNGSSTLSDYYSAHPTSHQFDAITAEGLVTARIANGALQYSRSGTASTAKGSLSRSTDFTPAPNVMIYRFDLQVSGNSGYASSAGRWQVGAGFSTANDIEPDAQAHSQVGLVLSGTGGTFGFRDLSHPSSGEYSATYSGVQTITWIVNNSGAPFSYLAPNNTWQTVGNDKWDLYAGWLQAFDERPATPGGAGKALTDLKFFFGSGLATVTIDNLQIQNEVPMPVVPESDMAGILAIAVAGIASVAAHRNRRRGATGASDD